MVQEQDEDLVRVLDGKNRPSMLGSEKFIAWIKDQFFKKKNEDPLLFKFWLNSKFAPLNLSLL